MNFKSLPDKLVYKTTITSTLRIQISSACREILGLDSSENTYLEIGFDKGITMLSVRDSFISLTGIDIDPLRAEYANSLFQEICSDEEKKKLKLIIGNSDSLPTNHYDVVLIDAGHDYENVKKDYENVLKNNLSKKFVIFFHDYGLITAGVKKFVDSNFESDRIYKCGMQNNWNPHGGPISDWEAIYVIIQR